MKPATLLYGSLSGLAVAGSSINKRQIQECARFEDDIGCQRAFRACSKGLEAKKQPSDVEDVMKCLDTHRLGFAKFVKRAGQGQEGKATPFRADIRVDANRDGVTDLKGTSDIDGKRNWTESSGAIFLANIGDTNDRCKKLHPVKDLESFEALAKCHDASDDEQHAPRYMARMLTVPIPGLSKSAKATVTISDDQVAPLVRIFRALRDGEKWEMVKNDTVFSAEDVQRGIQLGIDARDTRRPGGWDGRVKVDFTVEDGETKSQDTAMLRVAPVLLHHHRQPIQKLFAPDFPASSGDTTNYINRVERDIENSMKVANIPGPISKVPTDDVWTQDWFEPGYTSMPGPNSTVVSLRVMIVGRHDSVAHAERLVYTHLRGEGVGGIDATPSSGDTDNKYSTLRAGGNIETIPPYEFNGKKFPSGRVVAGGDKENYPPQRDFFVAQGVQDPLILDSTWLHVKHFDEMFQFVPSKTQRGWSVLAIDPQHGIEILRLVQKTHGGEQRVISRGGQPVGPTINEFLADNKNMEAAKTTSKHMAANIKRLMKETGITEAEIFRLPALFGPHQHVKQQTKPISPYRRAATTEPSNKTAEIEMEEMDLALEAEILKSIKPQVPQEDSAYNTSTAKTVWRRKYLKDYESFEPYLPSLVNGLPLSDSHYIAPKPHGPIVNGQDVFERRASDTYKKAGFATVDFIDEWMLHQVSGDLHCFTNTFRDSSVPWW
ncbi:hypothetical protein QQS21_002480 [Conoideocrella luteorostrata]|uniref:Protein-arginine deiminase C-terminal domain-containing protein n=1 Tax=Conoideocrella luteorostrata TaxID=1105319 RepID=A0AAJ0CV70_9HYPO|nr:hypothetical protein QQS21_002480 [Conoideocrella luteorostrata]